MGGEQVGVCQFPVLAGGEQPRQLSPGQLEAIDRRVREFLHEAQQRAAELLAQNRALVKTLRDLLLERKVIDAQTLATLVPRKPETGPGDSPDP
jgi:ATP-dependent Zn protease